MVAVREAGREAEEARMRIAFAVGHPAHVHLFKNAARLLLEKGHIIRFFAIRKEMTERLLKERGFAYEIIGESHRDLVSKATTILVKDITVLKELRVFKPDILVSTGSPYFAQASAILSIPHLAFGDTEIAKWTTRLMLPFTDAVYTPQAFSTDLGPKQRRYHGYKELAYLHPDYFTPRQSVRDSLVKPDEKLILIRLSSWDSSHDLHYRGKPLSRSESLDTILHLLRQYGRVYISSEVPLISKHKAFDYPLSPDTMHDALAFSSFYFGEGATMASEAGVLGVPWVFFSEQHRGYLDDQEKGFNLGMTTDDLDMALQFMEKVLKDPTTPGKWVARRKKLLDSCVDVTQLLVQTILTWPGG
jgi:predicted glycosyltransferase